MPWEKSTRSDTITPTTPSDIFVSLPGILWPDTIVASSLVIDAQKKKK